jgi:hypothetical protein
MHDARTHGHISAESSSETNVLLKMCLLSKIGCWEFLFLFFWIVDKVPVVENWMLGMCNVADFEVF